MGSYFSLAMGGGSVSWGPRTGIHLCVFLCVFFLVCLSGPPPPGPSSTHSSTHSTGLMLAETILTGVIFWGLLFLGYTSAPAVPSIKYSTGLMLAEAILTGVIFFAQVFARKICGASFLGGLHIHACCP